jgi:CRISPR-associated endonuclease/helicase Cas3
MEYFAHSSPTGVFHGLARHLTETAKRAEAAAEKLQLRSWGSALGLLHDLGKYSPEFQARVRGATQTVDHSTYGTQTAELQYGKLGRLLAYCVAGHHGGLPNGADNGSGDGSTLLDRVAKTVPDATAWRHEIELPSTLSNPNVSGVRPERLGFTLAHTVRMAFSALVDADHLDTEQWSAAVAGYRVARGGWPSLDSIAKRLDEHMATFAADSKVGRTPAEMEVRRIRAEILTAARNASALPPGLFSMTVPTGGGKTLASIVWALDHAQRHGLDRVIIAIPFTSIIEQTADVLRRALGDLAYIVIEHHSAYKELSDDERRTKQVQAGKRITWASDHRVRRASENWDAPIVVTTNVQLYESLFSNKPSQCRKLHNIARSVIIIDEAQSLPPAMLMPCVAVLEEMARGYGTSILLCTATQPAIVEIPDRPNVGLLGEGLRGVREIAPARLHERASCDGGAGWRYDRPTAPSCPSAARAGTRHRQHAFPRA